MTKARVLIYAGCIIAILLFLTDYFICDLSSSLMTAGLWVAAIIEIIGFYLERHNKK